jgi:hypothetical protein
VQEVLSMPLRSKRERDADKEVKSARLQVDLAVLKMAQVLNSVQEQANKAKEELHHERRTA